MPKLLLFAILASFTIVSKAQTSPAKAGLEEQTQTLFFTENKGQVSDQDHNPRPDVLFSGSANGMVYHLRNTGISYQLNRIDSWKEEGGTHTKSKIKSPDAITIHRVDINWLNCNSSAKVVKDKATGGYANYFLSVCPNGVYDVKAYKGVTYKNIYPHIDLHYYEKNGGLKYDYIVAPFADYSQLQLEVKGVEKIEQKQDRSLIFKTELGDIREGAPLVFQNGKRLNAKWIIRNNVLSFDIKNYDPALSMVIDPTVRVWGTYYGSNFTDFGLASCTDALGNVYLAGQTMSNNGTVIATSGSHQSSFASGNIAFLAKFNSSGVRQWGTYYGVESEWANSCAVDISGNVYMAGVTQATTTPSVIATSASHQGTFGGGGRDAFLVKFNASGVKQWGTFYGGSGADEGLCCSADAASNIYLTGWTYSTGTVISTASGFQSVAAGTTSWAEAFLVKFNASGVRQWGTFYGSSGDDYGWGSQVDASGNIYMCGYTGSSSSGTAIASSGSYQSTLGGYYDAFLAKFDPSGNRVWGTFYGGAGNDYGQALCTDALRHVYVTGYTASTGTVMATVGSQQSSFSTIKDAYLVQFDSTGQRQWGTYYGDAGDDEGTGCSVNLTNGDVYICGVTTSTTSTAIGSTGSYQSNAGGSYDAFLAKFSINGTRLWGTYFGGGGIEFGSACCTDNTTGNIYLAGYTSTGTSGSVIATSNGHQSGYGGSTDAFLVKLYDSCTFSITAQSSATTAICSGASATLTATGATTYTWLPVNSTYSLVGITPTVTSTYTLQGTLSGCSTVMVNHITVVVNNLPTVTIASGAVCTGNSYTLSPSGAQTYTFSSGSPVVSPLINTTYTIGGTSAQGCISASSATTSVIVNPLPVLTITGNNSVCKNSPISLLVNGNVVSYTWSAGGNTNLLTITPTVSGVYSVSANDANNCIGSASKTIVVTNLPSVTALASNTAICLGDYVVLNGAGANSYNWANGIVNGVSFLPPVTADYIVTGTDANGCKDTALVRVIVNISPTITITDNSTFHCVGETSTLSVSGSNSYTWSTGDTTHFISVTPALSTEYSVTATDRNGCISTMSYLLNLDFCLSLQHFNAKGSGLSVYPNPAAGEFIIESDETVSIKITNAIGQLILEEKLLGARTKIDLANYSDGVYFIQCYRNNSLQTLKLIKKQN